MKRLICLAVSLITLFASAQQPAIKKATVLPFKKLSGNWIMKKKNGTIMGETWEMRDNNSMSGKSFMIQKGDTIILETVDLLKKEDGIFYIPVAFGQNQDKPVPFKLTAVKDNTYFFENPDHDFPKRIVYHFTGPHTLHAYIDDGTEKKRQHYYYKKQR